MAITAAEQADLDIMKQKREELYRHFSDLCISYFRMRDGSEELKHTGHKSVAEALLFATKHHEKELTALAKAHVKKWPD